MYYIGSDLFQELRKGSNTAAEGKGLRWRPRRIDECVPAASGGDGVGASDGSDDDDVAANVLPMCC